MQPGGRPPDGHPDYDKADEFRDRLWDAEIELSRRCRDEPPSEQGRLFDHTTAIETFSGDLTRVFLPPDRNSAGEFIDLLFTHNHPGDTSFSVGDVMAAFCGNWRELRAVNPLASYSAKRPGSGWPKEKWLQIARVAEARLDEAARVADDRFGAGEDPNRDWIGAVTSIWRAIATAYSIPYSEFEAPGQSV